jgi:hypothetical protein
LASAPLSHTLFRVGQIERFCIDFVSMILIVIANYFSLELALVASRLEDATDASAAARHQAAPGLVASATKRTVLSANNRQCCQQQHNCCQGRRNEKNSHLSKKKINCILLHF